MPSAVAAAAAACLTRSNHRLERDFLVQYCHRRCYAHQPGDEAAGSLPHRRYPCASRLKRNGSYTPRWLMKMRQPGRLAPSTPLHHRKRASSLWLLAATVVPAVSTRKVPPSDVAAPATIRVCARSPAETGASSPTSAQLPTGPSPAPSRFPSLPTQWGRLVLREDRHPVSSVPCNRPRTPSPGGFYVHHKKYIEKSRQREVGTGWTGLRSQTRIDVSPDCRLSCHLMSRRVDTGGVMRCLPVRAKNASFVPFRPGVDEVVQNIPLVLLTLTT